MLGLGANTCAPANIVQFAIDHLDHPLGVTPVTVRIVVRRRTPAQTEQDARADEDGNESLGFGGHHLDGIG